MKSMAAVALQAMVQPQALLVPGIGVAYSMAAVELRDVPEFRMNCARAGIDDFRDFPIEDLQNIEPFLRDTLENQKLSYVVNCTMSDIHASRGIIPQVTVGYSMGFYAALYAAGCCSFQTGLTILEKAYELVSSFCESREEEYKAVLILGITEEELRTLIFSKVGQGPEIVIYNGNRNFLVTGEKEAMEFCQAKALELGAVSARPILTRHPYHHPVLEEVAKELNQILDFLPYQEPIGSVLSPIDGTSVSKADIARTVAKAICTPIHFDQVIEALNTGWGMPKCLEVGPAQAMKRLVRYIHKDVMVQSFKRD